uniref:Uncharacterized protein n=1 Tax=Globodera rostochiensis TaxID=31243 RepID=A0A914I8H2_GLORO
MVETPAGVGFFCADIERALKFRLQSAKDNLKYIDANVLLKLSGDFGQGFTKITISFGEAQRPNSPAKNFVAAVFPAKDSRANMEVYGGTLWDQIDQLKLLDGRKVKWFLGGDLSFVWGIVGHCGSARTTFPSPVCTCGRDQLLDEDKCRLRSVTETVQQAQQFGQAIQRGESATKALRSATIGIVKTPLLPAIDFDRLSSRRSTSFKASATRLYGNSSGRRHAKQRGNGAAFTTEWPKTICMALAYLGKIQAFSKAQPLLPREVAELEDHMDNFKAFIVDQPQMRLLLSQKPKAHLLLVHFVPFARQHHFLGLMDEQGDEALHSVWRRLEQLWKTMPDVAQIRQNSSIKTQSTAELEQDRMDDEEDDEDYFADAG